MWGPLTRLRRWWRPLPTVGHVFCFRRIWDHGAGSWARRIGPSGFEVDILVREPDVEIALGRAIAFVALHVDPDVELVATRAADIRDFPRALHLGQIGPRRHFGAGRGLSWG